MNRFKVILALAAMMFSACSPDSGYVSIRGYAQGGMYEVKLCAKNASESPENLQKNIDSILVGIDMAVSGYNPGSTLSRFNRGERVEHNAIMMDLYERAWKIWQLTSGAVDCAAGPLYDIWGFGFTTDSLPSPEVVERTRLGCGMALLPPDAREMLSGVSSGKYPHTVLNFNCMAQGYSCDLIAAYLHEVGVHDMMINVGGEIFVEGKNPGGQNWRIGIDKPVDDNHALGEMVQGLYETTGAPCGLVTSGNYRKFYIKDGKKYSHSIDPRTGYPVSHSVLSATVIAGDATLADALATYCMVAGLDEASAFILADNSLEACILYDEDGKIKAWTSPGFVLIEK